jgi:hypothetical protein
MAWKICGLIGTLTLGLAALACDSSGDGTDKPGDGTTTDGTSTSGGTSTFEGHPLNPMNGWVARMDNEAGIQGAFYTFNDNEDGGDFVINPATYETAGATICADGTAEAVLNMEYAVYWGGAVGFNLNQEEGSDTAMAYDATANGVTGFGFDISTLPVGGQLRFNVLVSGEPENNYCALITATAGNEFRWEDLKLSCWAAMPTTPDPTKIEAVHWQIVTNENAPYDFNFCVSNITALTN